LIDHERLDSFIGGRASVVVRTAHNSYSQKSYLVVLSQALNDAAEGAADAKAVRGGASKAPIDIGLLLYFALWYLGNYYVSL
jgi:hypothetical protein